MEDIIKGRVDQLVEYIMKKCLWQFHSRTWDRERQNEGILTKTMQILCDELVETGTPADKCYWVDAVILAENYKEKYSWFANMDKSEIKLIMQGVKERIDFLTITGSLNKEINDALY